MAKETEEIRAGLDLKKLITQWGGGGSAVVVGLFVYAQWTGMTTNQATMAEELRSISRKFDQNTEAIKANTERSEANELELVRREKEIAATTKAVAQLAGVPATLSAMQRQLERIENRQDEKE